MQKNVKVSISLITLIITMTFHPAFSGQKPVIGIQPLGVVDTIVLNVVYTGIDSVYDAYVAFMPAADMPEFAYYKPRQRYRADKILDFLESKCDEAITKIIGLTDLDISTTKGEHRDWGIFGLGSLGGRTCVISTYRLGKDKVAVRKFYERIIKVANHELGHTFGLNHCCNPGCLMEDARGSIKTVDNEPGPFCPECLEQVRSLIKRREEP